MNRLSQNIAKVVAKVLVSLILLVPLLHSQTSSAKQLLTLQVLELNKIDLVGTNLMLSVESADASTVQKPSVGTNATLVWTSNGGTKKITVASNNSSSKFALKVSARDVSPDVGLTTSEVSLSDEGTRDLIVGFGKSAGKCQLWFTAVASEKVTSGNESHVITFTITSS